ncbi:MAG: NUDIX domain-containing protein [Nanoarchaeota archaeon]|nr:NUDIX domain-containing protein [Nanoarchaeota archaeon]
MTDYEDKKILEDNFLFAVKALVLNNEDKVLLLKRSETDPHSPGSWDLPGGILCQGESCIEGLLRETGEETSLAIEIMSKIRDKKFKRDDGQNVFMRSYLCKTRSHNVVLSSEHDEYAWLGLSDAYKIVHEGYHKDILMLEPNIKQ